MTSQQNRNRGWIFLLVIVPGIILSAGLFTLLREPEDIISSDGLPDQPIEVNLRTLDSDRILSVGEWQWKGEAVVAVSPDEKWIAVTGYDEYIHLFDNRGREKRRFGIPGGYGRALAFSVDSQILFAGECSMDAVLYAVDVNAGKMKWKMAISDDVGRPTSTRISFETLDKCCVYALEASDAALFAVGTHRDRHFLKNDTGGVLVKDILDTVSYALDPETGKLLWRYPAKGTMDTHMPYPLYSESLGHLVGANTSYWREGSPKERYPNGCVRLINAQTGLLSCMYRIMPTFTSFTSIWYSLSVSPNSRFISVGTTDGRQVLFEVKKGPSLTPVWEKKVSSLIEISGIPIYASIGHSIVFDNGDVFTASCSTHSKQTSTGVMRKPPIQHPDSNTAFIFNSQGRIKWKWKAPGDISGMSMERKTGLITVIVEHDYVEQSLEGSGFYFMRYSGKDKEPVKLLGSFQLKGISRSGAVSPSGSFFAGVEKPVRLPNDTLRGEHKLHIIPIRSLSESPTDD